ncbi:MAG: hypothetical protein KH117_17075 [Dysgonomonas sp.]|uniref:hypothetical protein n=1 Tax=Dysgonomonas sp. TaxID=1891233 RepID=UPI002579797A|nr:hypothetical protein [Dysgonomonas sp.]MBS7122691.1 hypothetical protein [Dysgonomonas sp.]
MGKIADDILDGMYCQHCGDYLGAPTGYPKSCSSCNKPKKNNRQNHQEPKYIRSIIDMCMSKSLTQEETIGIVNSYVGIKGINKGDLDENVKIIHSQYKRSFSEYIKSLAYLSKLTSTSVLVIVNNLNNNNHVYRK